jgi:hypothetical protein
MRHLALSLALTLVLSAPARAKETKTVILLETLSAAPIQCGGSADSKRVQQCLELSESQSDQLCSEVLVEMRLDPDCAGMVFATNFPDVKRYGKDADYINAVVTYFPITNDNEWWLNIVKINGKEGPPYMNGVASTAKEIAHKLCYIIHQEKITRR